jgi:hypothetical protein
VRRCAKEGGDAKDEMVIIDSNISISNSDIYITDGNISITNTSIIPLFVFVFLIFGDAGANRISLLTLSSSSSSSS